MIELVDRFEADDKRRIAVLFEYGRRKQRRFEAMRGVMADDAAKTAQRGASGRRLGVVGKRVQLPLHVERRAQPRDQPAFGRREAAALCPLPSAPKGDAPSAKLFKVADDCAGVHSLPV